MKISLILLFSGLALFSEQTLAATSSEVAVAKECLTFGKRVMKESPDMLNVLNQAKVDGEGADIQLNKYDDKIGKQDISAELVAKIHSNQEKLGTILCLFESDSKPLYFHYIPAE